MTKRKPIFIILNITQFIISKIVSIIQPELTPTHFNKYTMKGLLSNYFL